jgi:ion channel-forming bestrophin family protein
VIAYDTKSWSRLLRDVPRSHVFRMLALDVLGAGLYAALVVYLETRVIGLLVPIGPTFLSILGIILGLVLVFRTNTAYDRWWEARKLWGQLVNVSRGFAHQLDALLGDAPLHVAERVRYADMLSRLPAALSQHLCAPGTVAGDHAPLAIISRLHRAVHADLVGGRIASDARRTLAPLLQQFDDVTGACERIRNTPIPYSYSSYVKQFVLLYAMILPFGLAKDLGYGVVIASMLTFFATMGLELLAEEVEQPFGDERNDLPLEDLTATIAGDVHRILGVTPPPSTGVERG